MICPFRFKEFTSNLEMQECQQDCAWVIISGDGKGGKAIMCAVSVFASCTAHHYGINDLMVQFERTTTDEGARE